MTLYTAGYRRNGIRLHPDTFFGRLPNTAVVVDIRERRYSPGMPGYSGRCTSSAASKDREALYRLFTYRWLPELGNVKVDGVRRLPPTYKDPDVGFEMLERWLRMFGRVVIFCACEKVEECHRAWVAEEMSKRIPDLEVIHL